MKSHFTINNRINQRSKKIIEMCFQGSQRETKSSATKSNETEDLQKLWMHFLITIFT